jgi:TRAP-type C4-dicarboxylate transport system permease small subunit
MHDTERTTERAPWRTQLIVHALGLVASLVVLVCGWFVLAWFSFATTTCEDHPPRRVSLIVVVLLVGAVTATIAVVTALLARKQRVAAWPWFSLAVIAVALFSYWAATIHAARWCF